MRNTLSLSFGLAFLLAGCGTKWDPQDQDGDGISPAMGDCWDQVEGPEGTELSGADIYPGADDTPYDGIDANCAGDDDFDLDGDGWVMEPDHIGRATLGVPGSGAHEGAGDCWDDPAAGPADADLTAAEVNPGVQAADDAWYDGIDADCAGNDDFDQDLDGFRRSGDEDRSTFPTADSSLPGGDCDDIDAAIHPDAQEICDLAGIDEDCDGYVNGEDESVDLATALTWFADTDGDGFGDASADTLSCDQPDGYTSDDTDCDDSNDANYPDADEYCDGADNDCDGDIDEDDAVDATTWYTDADADGHGEIGSGRRSCEQPEGTVDIGGDCNDADGTINPDAQEVCDDANIDEDCDNLADDLDSDVDPGGFTTFWADTDGDSYGDPAAPRDSCDLPAAHATNNLDCDDGTAAINPGATEVCDAANTDEDCDGLADDADSSVSAATKTTWYRDADGDSYGSSTVTTSTCDLPTGYVSNNTDCNDASAAINPAATEVCDAGNTDEDCDGLADDADSSVSAATYSTFYRDADGDGYGDATTTRQSCDVSTGYVVNSTDCNDAAADINPGATEVCDASDVDEDCDGLADDNDSSASGKTTWYYDYDGDTYGQTLTTLSACDQPTSYANRGGDCDDLNAAINPAAQEICDTDNTDEDCDGVADNYDSSALASGFSTFYLDSDGDDFGVTGSTQDNCDEPSGYALVDGDCDDSDPLINPDAFEACNDGDDNDCDGTLGSRDPSAAFGECAYSDAAITVAHWIYTAGSNNTELGDSLAFIGDINGDGNDDIAVGVPKYDRPANSNAGGVYILSNLDATVNDLDATVSSTASSFGTLFYGANVADRAGQAVAGGDIDSDATAEVFIGAPYANPATGADAGTVYYLSGAAGWNTGGDLSAVAVGGNGLGASDFLGWDISLDGDFDGDNKADLLMGAPEGDTLSTAGAGYALLLTSTTLQASGFATTGTIPYNAKLEGAGTESAGWAVDFVDLDGDGLADPVVGAPHADGSGTDRGRVYVAEAPVSGVVTLSGESILTGTGNNAFTGYSLAHGDVNGDGHDDLLAGGRGALYRAGTVEVVFGSATVFSSSTLTIGATILGTANQQDAWSIAAGDTDADGIDDVIVGSPSTPSNGAIYLVSGPISSGTVALTTATNVAQLSGAASGDGLGRAVASGGDANGDGNMDILAGAPYHGTDAGRAYLLFGLGL